MTSSWLYLNGPSYGIPKLSQIAFSKILPVSSVLSGAGAGAGAGAAGTAAGTAAGSVIARIVSRILCTITFTSVSADRVLAAAEYKTDVIDGMEWNGISVHLLLLDLTFQFFVIFVESRIS